jgi:putative transposase
MHLAPRDRVHLPPRSLTRLAVHLVWTTRAREPLLEPRVDEWLATFLLNQARAHACDLIAAGNASDHVHVLITHPPTVAIADLAQRLKATTSHEWNRRLLLDRRLAWQSGYWAETCDPNDLGVVVHRLLTQRALHGSTTAIEAWERAFEAAPV